MMWPSQRLESNSRYIVALRNIKNNQGVLVTPSPAFALLR